MKKILEKMKEKRLQFENWLKNNKDKPFMYCFRLIPLILVISILIGNSCQNKRTALAETTSNGFSIELPTLVSSFSSVSTTGNVPMYAYSYNTAYNITLNFLTSPTGVHHLYFKTYGGSDGNDVQSSSFTIDEGQTEYRFYSINSSTSPYVNSTLYYAYNMFASQFPLMRPLNLTLDCVDIGSVTHRFPQITTARFSSPYSLSTLSFYRVTLRGDYGENDSKTWFFEVFAPIQIENYALFNNNSSLFVDLSNKDADQYKLGFNAGVKSSQNDAFKRGYDNGKAVGYQQGYDVGIEEQLSNVSPLRVVFNSISDILKMEIIPYVKLGYLLTLVIGVLAISLVFKRG